MKVYHAHVYGFSGTFPTLDDLKTWVNDLRAKYSLEGKVLQIHRGTRHGTVCVYEPNCPYREIVIGE